MPTVGAGTLQSSPGVVISCAQATASFRSAADRYSLNRPLARLTRCSSDMGPAWGLQGSTGRVGAGVRPLDRLPFYCWSA